MKNHYFIFNFSGFWGQSDKNYTSLPVYLLFGKLYRLHADYDGNGCLISRKMAPLSPSNDPSPGAFYCIEKRGHSQGKLESSTKRINFILV